MFDFDFFIEFDVSVEMSSVLLKLQKSNSLSSSTWRKVRGHCKVMGSEHGTQNFSIDKDT